MVSKENEYLISRYDDPDLSPAELQQLGELLETDDAARKLEAKYRRLDAELETLPDGLDGVDLTGLSRRVRQRIESAAVIPLPRRRLWTRWAPIAAAASVAISLISLWYVFKPEPISPRHPLPTSPIATVSPMSKMRLATIEPANPKRVVNRIRLSMSPATVEEQRIAMDIKSDSVYDTGGIICSVGSENDASESHELSMMGFLSTLLKGST